jgi:hypothetical protein
MRIYMSLTLVLFYALTSAAASTNDEILAMQVAALQSKVIELQQELAALKSIVNKPSSNLTIDDSSNRETIISDRNKLILKAGKSSLELTKDGDIRLTGRVFNVNTSNNQEIRGSKIKEN